MSYELVIAGVLLFTLIIVLVILVHLEQKGCGNHKWEVLTAVKARSRAEVAGLLGYAGGRVSTYDFIEKTRTILTCEKCGKTKTFITTNG